MNPKLCLIIGIICISFSPIFVKLAEASPIVSGFYRMSIAWVALAVYAIAKGQIRLQTKDLLMALLGGIIFAADIAIWNMSLMLISATVSTLLANLAPVWVGLMSYLFFRKKSGALFWAGTFIAIAGMVVLVGPHNVLHLQINWGLILALIASFLYALYIVFTKGLLQRINTFSFMFWSMLASSLFLLMICFIRGDNVWQHSTISWLNFAGMGLICQLAGWLTINYAIMHLEATKVSVSLLMQTVIAGILAAFMLNEKLEAKELIGSAIVLAGIAVTFLKPRKLNNL